MLVDQAIGSILDVDWSKDSDYGPRLLIMQFVGRCGERKGVLTLFSLQDS